MQLLTPSRFVAVAAVVLAALGLAVAYMGAGASAAPAAAGRKACVHGTALLERNKANVVAYYTRAFNDKEPEDAVERYVGFDEPGQDLDGSASRTSTSSTTRWRGAELPRSSSSFGALRRRSPTCTSTSGASSPNATSS